MWREARQDGSAVEWLGIAWVLGSGALGSLGNRSVSSSAMRAFALRPQDNGGHRVEVAPVPLPLMQGVSAALPACCPRQVFRRAAQVFPIGTGLSGVCV